MVLYSVFLPLIQHSGLSGVTTVKKYNEADLQQEAIGEEEFYCRYTLEYNARRIDVSTNSFILPCMNLIMTSQNPVSTPASANFPITQMMIQR
jgi:hypothetical protein